MYNPDVLTSMVKLTVHSPVGKLASLTYDLGVGVGGEWRGGGGGGGGGGGSSITLL